MLQDLRFNIMAVDKSLAAFQSVRGNVAKTGAEIRALGSAGASAGLGTLFGRAGLLGMAGVAGVVALGHAVGNVVADAAKLVDIADKLGITTTQLQELHFAADQTGVEIAEMNSALSFFARQIGIASTGTGDLYDILKANGVALRDQSGHMRPLIDLFRDYAELVKRASSDTDRTRLATVGFGRANDGLVNTLRDGRQGLKDYADEAKRAGAILGDEDQLRRIAELDDRWAKFARTMETEVKSAILGVVDALAQIGKTDAQIAAAVPAQLTAKITGMRSALEDQKALLATMPGNTILQGEIKRQEAEIAVLEARLGTVKAETTALGGGTAAPGAPIPRPKPTIIPGKQDPEQKRLADAIKEVNKDLDLQIANLGRSAREQAAYNAVAQAGVSIDSAAGKVIAEKARLLFDEQRALEDAKKAQEAFNSAVLGLGEAGWAAFESIITGAESAEQAILNLVKQLLLAEAKALFLNAITGGKSPLGPIAAVFGGFKAEGGALESGKWYIAGERGPEPIWGGGSGAFAAGYGMRATSGGTPQVKINVINRGEPVSARQGAQRFDGKQMVVDVILDTISSGKADGALGGRFGARPHTRRLG